MENNIPSSMTLEEATEAFLNDPKRAIENAEARYLEEFGDEA